MATDLEKPARTVIQPGPRLTVVHSRTEIYSIEHKTMRTEYSETVVRAQVGVARARYMWPVVATVGGSAVVGVAIAAASVALKYPPGLIIAGCLLAPATLAGVLKTLGVDFGKDAG
jgi:hypothetical protein